MCGRIDEDATFTPCPCLRPYHVESTSSRQITEVKQHFKIVFFKVKKNRFEIVRTNLKETIVWILNALIKLKNTQVFTETNFIDERFY